jgi:hypothetical protein
MKPEVDVIRLIEKALDANSGLSTIEEIEAGLSGCCSVLLMSDHSDIAFKISNLEAVIGYVRELRGALDGIFSNLEPQPTETALAYARELRTGLDTTVITLEQLAWNLRGAAKTGPHAERIETLLLNFCRKCRRAFRPDAPHDCDAEKNCLGPEDIDLLIGEGQRRILIAWSKKPVETSVHCELTETSHGTPRPLRMREGSKKHRVYVETKKLLEQHGQMHIDDMIERVATTGVFVHVKDQRINYSNILSQLKAKGLLTSDNHGNWSLPNGKAAE